MSMVTSHCELELFLLFEGRVTRGEFVWSESDFRFVSFRFVQTISDEKVQFLFQIELEKLNGIKSLSMVNLQPH